VENTDAKNLWTAVTAKIAHDISADAAEMWLKPVKALVFDHNSLKLEVPNQVFYQTLRERYEKNIMAALRDITGAEAIVEYSIPMGSSSPAPLSAPEHIQPRQPEHRHSQAAFPNRLNPNYIFDEFVEGPSNRFACGVGRAVAKKVGDKTSNPFVIFSKPGLGKTHILHAIGNEIIKNSAGAKVLYLSGEEFVYEYIESLQNKTSDSFRKKYRSLDCFLVDDIQFVAGKEASEKEFFYTFNALVESKKQIVLTSDRMPNELSIDQRLSSRLLAGIVAEIKPPDEETRIAILRKKRDKNRFAIPDEVINFLGASITASVREMEGALYQLNSYCAIHNSAPTVSVAKELLGALIDGEKRVSVDIDTIKNSVARQYKLDVEDFNSKKKSHSISWPRQIAMYLAHELTECSLPEIGRAFDRDHSTVVHARDQVKRKLESDPFFSAEINQMKSEIAEGSARK